jgi:regulator of protease activity HflC (stomatin/prohibitin superfamily)
VATDVGVRVFDIRRDGGAIGDLDAMILKTCFPSYGGLAVATDVQQHEVGLLYRNGVLEKRLPPGRHVYWTPGVSIRVANIDVRPQAVEVTAQEILTRDKVQVRLTVSLFHRIVDPERVVAGAVDVSATLYKLVQFALREAVAIRTLDELLGARDKLDEELRAALEERAPDLGITITDVGVKDVILPGEIRELVNKVIDAERTAKANLIRRQEETAATRSLLNTARLMEDNPVLLRLKELETLERLVEKVGKIDLHASAGTGLDALLEGLVRRTESGPRASAAAVNRDL